MHSHQTYIHAPVVTHPITTWRQGLNTYPFYYVLCSGMSLYFSDDPMLSVFSFAYWPSDRILCLLILVMFNLLNFFPLWLMFDIKSNDNLCPTKKRSRTTLNVGFCHGLLVKITHCLPWKEKLLELCFYFP